MIRLLKLALAGLIAIGVFGVLILFEIGVCQLPFIRRDPGGWLSAVTIFSSIAICVGALILAERSFKHIPALHRFERWLEDKSDGS